MLFVVIAFQLSVISGLIYAVARLLWHLHEGPMYRAFVLAAAVSAAVTIGISVFLR